MVNKRKTPVVNSYPPVLPVVRSKTPTVNRQAEFAGFGKQTKLFFNGWNE
jgi:hypothetical protein